MANRVVPLLLQMATGMLGVVLLTMAAVDVTSGRFLSHLQNKVSYSPCSQQTAIVNANSKFAFALYHKMRVSPSGENMIFSPFSVSTALAMTYGGANGVTKSEMASALRFGGMSSTSVHSGFRSVLTLLGGYSTVKTANKIYVDNQFVLLVCDFRSKVYSKIAQCQFTCILIARVNSSPLANATNAFTVAAERKC